MNPQISICYVMAVRAENSGMTTDTLIHTLPSPADDEVGTRLLLEEALRRTQATPNIPRPPGWIKCLLDANAATRHLLLEEERVADAAFWQVLIPALEIRIRAGRKAVAAVTRMRAARDLIDAHQAAEARRSRNADIDIVHLLTLCAERARRVRELRAFTSAQQELLIAQAIAATERQINQLQTRTRARAARERQSTLRDIARVLNSGDAT